MTIGNIVKFPVDRGRREQTGELFCINADSPYPYARIKKRVEKHTHRYFVPIKFLQEVDCNE